MDEDETMIEDHGDDDADDTHRSQIKIQAVMPSDQMIASQKACDHQFTIEIGVARVLVAPGGLTPTHDSKENNMRFPQRTWTLDAPRMDWNKP